MESDSRATTDVGWEKEWETCACGKPCGPNFRYFLCDDCAGKTPETVLFRLGVLLGVLLRYRREAEDLKANALTLNELALVHGTLDGSLDELAEDSTSRRIRGEFWAACSKLQRQANELLKKERANARK